MLRRLPRVRLRLAHFVALRLRFRSGHDQAHRRRTPAVLRVALLLPVVAVAGLAVALQAGSVTRASKPWSWTPLPATAFGSLPSTGQTLPGSGGAEDVDDRSLRVGPSSGTAGGVRGGGDPVALPSTGLDPALRDRGAAPASVAPTPAAAASVAPAQVPAGAAVTVRGGGPDALSFTAVVRPTPAPVPTPVPAPVRAPKGPTHVVAAGDNLWTIARRHSAELAPILRWNEGVDPDRLVAGQRILVPGGAKMKPLPNPLPEPARSTSGTASVRPASNQRTAAPRAQDGDHIWPLEVRGDLNRRFSSAHPGIDIAAPQGTRVRAIADGTVVWAGWKNNGGGYVVEVEHPGGMRSTYNHNSKLTVERGDKVAQGDTIALVGSTGNSTGPHLDIRIWMGGRLVDPLDFY